MWIKSASCVCLFPDGIDIANHSNIAWIAPTVIIAILVTTLIPVAAYIYIYIRNKTHKLNEVTAENSRLSSLVNLSAGEFKFKIQMCTKYTETEQ